MAVWWDGKWVIDLWGSWADAAGTPLWKRDSGSYAGASTVGNYAFCFATGTMGSHDRANDVENAPCLRLPLLDA